MSKWKDKTIIAEIAANSKTKKEMLEKLGLRAAGSNHKTLNKYLQLYEISISHFDNNFDRIRELSIKNRIPTNEILVKNSTYTNRENIKKRLYEKGIKKRECEKCGQGEIWYGEKISLILDHINGIHNDHRIENLRILCPNCNATLPTHCGKNSYKKTIKAIFDNCKCGNLKRKKSKVCNVCNSINRRKVERPSYEKLKILVKRIGYSATGRKYGVSDNAIRKWIKVYEKEL